YVMIASIAGVVASIILFYKWIRNHGVSSALSFLATFLFLCAAPLILHSHRHIMFVNYMPFLIWSLMSVDKYFKSGKRLSLIISTFLIIMSSYYYSIPSLMVIVIYGVYVFLKKYDKVTVKLFFQEGFKFLWPIIIAIMMAGILLFPTMHTILNGRNATAQDASMWQLVIPRVNVDYLIYSSYSVGLTAIVIFALAYALISRKKEKIFMGAIISLFMIFPIFVFALNGFLYENAKVLIPFLPICCYLIALFFDDLFKNEVEVKNIIILVLIISIISYFTISYVHMKAYLLEILGISLMLLLWHYKKIKVGLIVVVMIVPFVTMVKINMDDELLSKEQYENTFSEDVNRLYNKVLAKEENIYRSSNLINLLATSNRVYNNNYYNTTMYSSAYNPIYKEFYADTFSNALANRNYLMLTQTNNILWDTFMGIKYVVSTGMPTIGYQEVLKAGKYKIYENESVLPIGYANSKLMSKQEFESLGYPYKLEALLNYTIVDNAPKSNYETKIKEYKIEYNDIDTKQLKISKEKEEYKIEVDEATTIKIPLPEVLNNQVLMLKFNMNYEQSCSKGDTSITINGMKNVLTCDSWKYKNQNKVFEYAIASNKELNELKVRFSAGTFIIDCMEAYVIDYDEIKKVTEEVDTFYFDKEKTKGDIIEGHIRVTEDGYFSLSVPYDEGFRVYVNDKEVDYELVNTAFIGLPLDKGEYKIKIVYTAPLRNIGMVMSMLGIVFCAIAGVRDRRRSKNEKRED
ncbi:MAG: YfhO family protein, partial [Bacilli bacterium]|nr:YfhO family protein [Bacilli bacterium]